MHKKNYRATTLDTVGVRVQYRALYKHTQEHVKYNQPTKAQRGFNACLMDKYE